MDHIRGEFSSHDDDQFGGDSSHICIILVMNFLPIDDDQSGADSFPTDESLIVSSLLVKDRDVLF
jgi:hypothetical protein